MVVLRLLPTTYYLQPTTHYYYYYYCVVRALSEQAPHYTRRASPREFRRSRWQGVEGQQKSTIIGLALLALVLAFILLLVLVLVLVLILVLVLVLILDSVAILAQGETLGRGFGLVRDTAEGFVLSALGQVLSAADLARSQRPGSSTRARGARWLRGDMGGGRDGKGRGCVRGAPRALARGTVGASPPADSDLP